MQRDEWTQGSGVFANEEVPVVILEVTPWRGDWARTFVYYMAH